MNINIELQNITYWYLITELPKKIYQPLRTRIPYHSTTHKSLISSLRYTCYPQSCMCWCTQNMPVISHLLPPKLHVLMYPKHTHYITPVTPKVACVDVPKTCPLHHTCYPQSCMCWCTQNIPITSHLLSPKFHVFMYPKHTHYITPSIQLSHEAP
jgi:hypothetical protein